MPTGHRRSPRRPNVDPACDPLDPVELWAARLAQFVLLLTSLGDRYEAALVPSGPRESRERVAVLRRAEQAAREGLVDMALASRTETIPSPGESEAQRDVSWDSALTARTEIGQAQGLIMQRHQVGASTALKMLKFAARDRAVTLGQVSREVVGAQEPDGV